MFVCELLAVVHHRYSIDSVQTPVQDVFVAKVVSWLGLFPPFLMLKFLALSSLSLSDAHVEFTPKGFGVQRLKGLKLKEPTSCENVEVFYYKEAVIDNFAPINNQKIWEGAGQRYWVNKQFWTGPGAPVFVFIGGEGEESCRRLTSKVLFFAILFLKLRMNSDVHV